MKKMRKTRKKGVYLLTDLKIIIPLLLILFFVFLYLINNNIVPGINIAGSMVDESTIQRCIAQNQGALDSDGDGIPDNCDICVLKINPEGERMLRNAIRDSQADSKIKWTLDDVHSKNPSTSDPPSEHDKYDKDRDGIVGICDSDPNNKARGRDIVKSECEKVKEKFQHLQNNYGLTGFTVQPTKSSVGGYSVCHIIYNP